MREITGKLRFSIPPANPPGVFRVTAWVNILLPLCLSHLSKTCPYSGDGGHTPPGRLMKTLNETPTMWGQWHTASGEEEHNFLKTTPSERQRRAFLTCCRWRCISAFFLNNSPVGYQRGDGAANIDELRQRSLRNGWPLAGLDCRRGDSRLDLWTS